MIERQKQSLRKKMRLLLAGHAVCSSDWISDALLTTKSWQQTSTILLFSPLHGEPDPTVLLKHAGRRRVLFPKVDQMNLRIFRKTPKSRWINGPYGLLEPDPRTWIEESVENVGLALVPGLAFDGSGGRLGRGAGFYDRLLGNPRFRGCKIGVAWSWQMIPSVPRQEHDVLMDRIISGP